MLAPFLLLAASAPFDEAQVRLHAAQSVTLLQKVAAQWKSPCLSCHHQSLPAMALEAARAHGIRVDEVAAQAAARRTFRYLADLDAAVRVDFLIDPAFSEGYSLIGASASGVKPNLSLAVYARHIARQQRADGNWAAFDARPPQGEGVIPATAVAARAMALYLPAALAADRDKRLARARKWLLSAKPRTTEDLTYRLLGLLWTGASIEERKTAIDELVKAQRSDGGWGQLAAIKESDAYSTGQALVALRRAGGWERTQPEFAQGVAWLLKSQQADASWHVQSRIHTKAPVSPPYFESGFPYGHDQFISCSATAWAVMALAEALPAVPAPARPLPVAGVEPVTAPWMEKALFGKAADMASVDPQAATQQGTTALMMAADDAGKVKALLARGAKARVTASSGYDALMIACLYPGNVETLAALMAAEASPVAREGVRYKASALPIAVFTGDRAMVTLLLEKFADPNEPMSLLGQGPLTPVNIAVNMDDGLLVRVLLSKGAKRDVKDDNGMTDLSWAALVHKNDAMRVLLELGADRTVRDKFGLTPLDHARDGIAHLSPETEQLLLRVW